MKKFFLVLVLLPLFSFADWYDPDFLVSIYCYKYNSSGTLTTPLVAETTASRIPVSAVEDWYFSHSFGVSFNSSNGSILYPTVQQGSGAMTNATKSMYCSLYTTNGVWYSLIRLAPAVSTYASYVVTFMRLGYDGSGINNVFTNANGTVTFNCTPSIVFADVLTSTNTVFRRALLEGISSLSTSVQNVNVDLGQFQRDYSFVNSSHFDVSNVIDVAESDSIIPSRVATSLKSMARNPSNYDYINSVLDSYRRSQWFPLAFSDSDLASPLHNDTRVKQGLKNLGDSFGAGASYHYTTPLTNELQKLNTNWVSEAKAALSNNTFQITNQLAHMFDDIPNSLGRAIRDTANNTLSTANAAGSIDQRLANGLTVSVVNSGASSVLVSLDGPINIDQTQFNSLSVPLGSLQRSISDWYSDWYSFFSVSSPVYKWENFYNMVSAFKDSNHIDLVSLHSCVSNLLLSLHGDITNSFVSTNGYLLLSDYADYIHSGGLDTLLDVMDDDSFSDLKFEIDSLYHADASEGYGRWWRYFTGLSTVQANSIFKLSNIFQAHEKLLTDLKRDNSDLDVQDASDPSVFRKLLYTIPSEEDTFNKLAQLTNSIDQSGMVRVQSLIPDLTNRLSVAASLFDKDFSLPTEISWELIPADPSINSKARIVTIRPYDHYRLFQMLHYGLAFSYCLVNLILFPKFLLLLVRLFDRVWNKSEKLIYNSTQS